MGPRNIRLETVSLQFDFVLNPFLVHLAPFPLLDGAGPAGRRLTGRRLARDVPNMK